MSTTPERSLNQEDYNRPSSINPKAEDEGYDRHREKVAAKRDEILNDPGQVEELFDRALESDAFKALLLSFINDDDEWMDSANDIRDHIKVLAKLRAEWMV